MSDVQKIIETLRRALQHAADKEIKNVLENLVEDVLNDPQHATAWILGYIDDLHEEGLVVKLSDEDYERLRKLR